MITTTARHCHEHNYDNDLALAQYLISTCKYIYISLKRVMK